MHTLKSLKGQARGKLNKIAYVCIAAAITLLLLGHASALVYFGFDAENGQLAGSVQAITDVAAANGQAIRFAIPNTTTKKIMPLGDSITHGYGSWSYRYWLLQKLKQAGITNVDMVGSLTSDNQTPDPVWDQDHEGHDGIRSSDVAERIVGWASVSHPDIVLMHLGTNSLQNNTTAGALSELSNAIDNLRSAVPNVTIVLAKIIPRQQPGPADHVAYNAGVATLASQKTTAQSPIIVVDQYTGFNVATDLWDGLHPNESGNQKMADKWYAALVPLLQ